MLDPKLKQTVDNATALATIDTIAAEMMDTLGCGEPQYIKDMRAAGLEVPERESPTDMLVRLGILKRTDGK